MKVVIDDAQYDSKELQKPLHRASYALKEEALSSIGKGGPLQVLKC